MATSEEIFQDALALPLNVRAELTKRIVTSLADVSPESTEAQLAEVYCSGRVWRGSSPSGRRGNRASTTFVLL
jgi:hypothetical protein